MRRSTTWALCLLLASCGSAPIASGDPPEEGDRPAAPPIARDHQATPPAPAGEAAPDANSPTRVLGYVEGDVITYREVVQEIGPQLAQLESAEERDRMVEHALMDVLREKMLYRAAVDANVKATREELEAEQEKVVKDLAKSGGTLDAFLHERSMSRREFEETQKRGLVVQKYQRAAIGRNNDPNVHVRPMADLYVSPQQVRDYYDRHPERYHEPATARCRVLAVKTDLEAADREASVAAARKKAEALIARLKAGEDWVPLYREAVQGAAEPEPDDGLVELRRGQKAKWLEDFAFDSPKGTLGEPKQVGTTFYVLRAEGAHDERTVPFDEASQRIREFLLQIQAQMGWLEVELVVLDESSIQPAGLRARLRDSLRQTRLKLLQDAGL